MIHPPRTWALQIATQQQRMGTNLPESSKYGGLARDLLHLVAWGQGGVLLRYYLGRVFGAACPSTAWVPCVTSPGLSRPGGALFIDLPANIVGCFIMGLLSPSELLLMAQASPAVVHSHTPTTAPHNHQDIATPQHDAPQVMISASADSTVAMHVADKPPSSEQNSNGSAAVKHTALVPIIQPGIPCAVMPLHSPLQRHTSLHLGLRTGLCGCTTTFASWIVQMVQMMVGRSPAARHASTEWFQALCGLLLGCLAAQCGLNVGQQVARMGAGHWYSKHHHVLQQKGRKQHQHEAVQEHVERQVVPGPDTHRHRRSNERVSAEQVQPHKCSRQITDKQQLSIEMSHAAVPISVVLCDALAMIMLLVLTAVSAALIGVTSRASTDNGYAEQHHAAVQSDVTVWVSILMGPIGCLLRWQLSSLNSRPTTSVWPWFPLGTWLANISACLLDYAMLSIQIRTPGLSLINSNTVSAVMAGVGGSLSTVSTWVVELQKLGYQVPGNNRALIYLLTSLVPAVVLGLLVYGTVAWTQ